MIFIVTVPIIIQAMLKKLLSCCILLLYVIKFYRRIVSLKSKYNYDAIQRTIKFYEMSKGKAMASIAS